MRIVGIAGGTASGKTSVARELAVELGAVQIAHDRYYRTLPDAFRDRLLDYNFDHPDALDTPRLVDDLVALRAGRSVRLVDYDFVTCARLPEALWTPVDPPQTVVVEGIMTLHEPALRALFDLTVFVDTPADIRLARRLLRDIQERGHTPEQVVEQYLATVRPMHEDWVEPSRAHAQLVLDGTRPVDASVRAICAFFHAAERG